MISTTNLKTLIKQSVSILSDERNKIANQANLCALIYHNLDQLNWVGFYWLDDSKTELVLGPFQGKIACTRIPVGKGVCGQSVAQNKTMLVDDVHQFDGHIACDSASNSEIVIPINDNKGNVYGVLDIDSPIFSRFSQEEQIHLEELVKKVTPHILAS